MTGVLPVVQLPDPRLRCATRIVRRADARLEALIESMVRTMRHHPRCVGLAAPQVGSDLRVAVMDATGHPRAPRDHHGLLVLVNPRLVASEGLLVQREGCLSVPAFTANVARAPRVRLSAWDRRGEPLDLWLEGFEAVIAQHEVDHLDGRLFLDRVANLKTDVFRRTRFG
jgi:peptide deformylase